MHLRGTVPTANQPGGLKGSVGKGFRGECFARRRCAGRIPLFFPQRLTSFLPHHALLYKAVIGNISCKILNNLTISVCAIFSKIIIGLCRNTLFGVNYSIRKNSIFHLIFDIFRYVFCIIAIDLQPSSRPLPWLLGNRPPSVPIELVPFRKSGINGTTSFSRAFTPQNIRTHPRCLNRLRRSRHLGYGLDSCHRRRR